MTPNELRAVADIFAGLLGPDADVWILGERKQVLVLVPDQDDFSDTVKRLLEHYGLNYSAERGGFVMLTG